MLAITTFESLAKRCSWAALLLYFSGANSLAIALSLLVSAPAQAASAGNAFVYRLDAGDIVNIYVYEEEDLSQEVEIGDSGVITYPLLGEVNVRGLSINELETVIATRLIDEEFLIAPDVTINIVEYRPFYIDGEVEAPGAYPFEPGLTLRMAVTLAGGFTERASRRNIDILPEPSMINSDNILETRINPGDIITVSQRLF